MVAVDRLEGPGRREAAGRMGAVGELRMVAGRLGELVRRVAADRIEVAGHTAAAALEAEHRTEAVARMGAAGHKVAAALEAARRIGLEVVRHRRRVVGIIASVWGVYVLIRVLYSTVSQRSYGTVVVK